MGTMCQLPRSEEDRRMIDEAIERGVEIPECFQRVMPEVERARAERCVECLRENVENAQNELRERLDQERREPTDFEKLDLELEPTEEECREQYNIGKKIGMEGWEISNYPMIVGIKDPETLERIPEMEYRIKDEMTNLHNSKLSPRFRDAEVVCMILFIDKDEPSPKEGEVKAGTVLPKGHLVSEPELSRVVHVFRDATGKLPEGQRAHRVVIHEICHLNFHKGKLTGEPSEFERVFRDNLDEWEKACKAQLDRFGPVGEAGKCIPKGGPREIAFSDPEFIVEHVAFWDANLGVEICPEMQEFFDKHLT